MNGFDDVKKITKFLSVIGVSDDAAIKDVFNGIVSGLFRRAVIVEQAEAGLEKLREAPVDIVIIDNALPTLSGLDMLKEIRKTDKKIPVIFIVAHADAPIIFDAINAGVTQFLLKPFQTDTLFNAFETALQRILAEREQSIENELMLIKQKDRHRLLEEKLSFERQLSIIKNDLYYRKIEIASQNGKKTEWLLNVRYKPKDVLSGDCYSVRTVDEDKILLFLIDAMGKGLSASFTTHHATTFANYLIDKEKMKGKFDFPLFVSGFQQFIRSDLHENESLSASFVFLDLKREIMDFALFSMPPLYLQANDETVIELHGCNMPIMKCTNELEIRRVALHRFKKMLICSDGLIDPLYEEYLDADFVSSSFIHMFYNQFSERVSEIHDDLTVIFLRRLEGDILWEKSLTIKALFEEVNRSMMEVEGMLTSAGYGFDFVMEFVNAYTEIIMNAYEHGSLNVSSLLKNKLAKTGEYEEYLIGKEKDVNARITVTLSALVDNKNEFVLVRVCDEGAGFDTTILRDTIRNPDFVDGRGLKMARSLVDEIYYNSAGNEAILLKVV
jgi:FixJ family two-component response regulator